jgi:uncharacterized peroxidase-related enzyme
VDVEDEQDQLLGDLKGPARSVQTSLGTAAAAVATTQENPMSRLLALDPAQTTGKTRSLLDGVGKKLGVVPNVIRTLATSPAALEGYLGLSGALGAGRLPAKLREQIALAVAEANGCEYCLAAHSLLGRNAGLADDDVLAARRGDAADARARAALRFVLAVVASRGGVGDTELERVRGAGFDDGEIAEIIAHVALGVLTNYLNRVAHTEVDFPKVASLAAEAVQ